MQGILELYCNGQSRGFLLMSLTYSPNPNGLAFPSALSPIDVKPYELPFIVYICMAMGH